MILSLIVPIVGQSARGLPGAKLCAWRRNAPQRKGKAAVASLIALALVLLLCYGAGLLARAAIGRALSESFEDRLHALYPRYTVIKGMAQGLSANAVTNPLKTVLVGLDDHQQMAVEVERLADGAAHVERDSISAGPTPPSSGRPGSGSAATASSPAVWYR